MKIVITAGGTKEAIDKVRHITNMSSGSLGKEISLIAAHTDEIEKIYYLSPKTAYPSYTYNKIELVETESVEDLYNNLQRILTTEKIDAVIHSMAVSDFTVSGVFTMEDLAEHLTIMLGGEEINPATILKYLKDVDSYKIDNSSKISSKSDNMAIGLKPTPKVIGNIKKWAPETLLVGFKLLENVTDERLIEVASEQMKKNDCDFVFANDIKRIREGNKEGVKGHQGLLITKKAITEFVGKDKIARGIIGAIVSKVRGE